MAHALYEMTFFGYCSKVVSKRVEEEKHILDERYKEIQSGTAQLIPFEEVMAETNYVDKRTPEEKDLPLSKDICIHRIIYVIIIYIKSIRGKICRRQKQ